MKICTQQISADEFGEAFCARYGLTTARVVDAGWDDDERGILIYYEIMDADVIKIMPDDGVPN